MNNCFVTKNNVYKYLYELQSNLDKNTIIYQNVHL